MKVKVTSGTQHPEGWYAFKILEEEVTEGQYGTQIKWSLQSSERSEDGEPIPMIYFTKTVLSKNEKCKLTNLFIACGVIESVNELDDEDDDWDTCVLLGKTFEGRVDEKTSDKGTFFNIGAVRPRKVKTQASKRKVETGEDDPFADQ